MQFQRVLLLSDQHLLGEGLERILRQVEGVKVIDSWLIFEVNLASIISKNPDLLLIAEEANSEESAANLSASILDNFPNLPLVRLKLSQNVFHVYTSKTFTADSAHLIKAIKQLLLSSPNGLELTGE